MLVLFFQLAAQFFHWTNLSDFYLLDEPASSIPELGNTEPVWAAILPGPGVKIDDRWIFSPVCLVFMRREGDVVIEVSLERVSNLRQGQPGSYIVGNIVGAADHPATVYNDQFDLGEIFSGLRGFSLVDSEPSICLGLSRPIDVGVE